MPRIPESEIERVREANDIVDVVSQYVRFEKTSGSNLFGLCPFHDEKTPSFSVSRNKQIYYCFGCHKGGNVIQFIMEVEHLSYVEAVRFLAKRAGIELREEEVRRDPQEELRKRLRSLLELTARDFLLKLSKKEGGTAAHYLRDRGVDAETAYRFGLGYAPENRRELYLFLKNKGFRDDEMAQSGLYRRNDRGLYTLFSNRLTFPIFDVFGKIIGMGGRRLDDDPKSPKYINSPETPLYHKGQHLYALNLAKRSRADRLLIVEGYLDAVSAHQAGFDQTAAVLGTALTAVQARLLRKYRSEVILCFDSDTAGQEASLRSIEVLKSAGVKPYLILLPEAKDPDEYLRKAGKERFSALLENPLTDVEYRLELARRKARNAPRGELLFAEEAKQIFAEIEDRLELNYYVRKLADELLLSPNLLAGEVEKLKEEQKRKKERTSPASESKRGKGTGMDPASSAAVRASAGRRGGAFESISGAESGAGGVLEEDQESFELLFLLLFDSELRAELPRDACLALFKKSWQPMIASFLDSRGERETVEELELFRAFCIGGRSLYDELIGRWMGEERRREREGVPETQDLRSKLDLLRKKMQIKRLVEERDQLMILLQRESEAGAEAQEELKRRYIETVRKINEARLAEAEKPL